MPIGIACGKGLATLSASHSCRNPETFWRERNRALDVESRSLLEAITRLYELEGQAVGTAGGGRRATGEGR